MQMQRKGFQMLLGQDGDQASVIGRFLESPAWPHVKPAARDDALAHGGDTVCRENASHRNAFGGIAGADAEFQGPCVGAIEDKGMIL